MQQLKDIYLNGKGICRFSQKENPIIIILSPHFLLAYADIIRIFSPFFWRCMLNFQAMKRLRYTKRCGLGLALTAQRLDSWLEEYL